MAIEYAIIVRNKTRLETLVERFNTRAQARFYIERSGGRFEDYEEEHQRFELALAEVQRQLSRHIRYKLVDRSFLPSFIFADNQAIIVIGQDGLVANTAKYANGRPIIGVNPDPERYDGVLLPFTPGSFLPAFEKVVLEQFVYTTASFAEARLNDGQRLMAFNDLFIGASTHISARYRIAYKNQQEDHSSSGVIVSTKAGSTGWMSSVFNMAFGIQAAVKAEPARSSALHLKSDQLLFAVREPFASRRSQTGIQMGLITRGQPLEIESYMTNYGVIFSDGIEKDFIHFNAGSRAVIGLAEEQAILVQP